MVRRRIPELLLLVCLFAGLPLHLLAVQNDGPESSSADDQPDLEFSVDDVSTDRQLVGAATRMDVLDNKDTLIITSGYGDFWFGVFGGPNLGTYLGDLNLALSRSAQLRNLGRHFGSGSSLGYFIGGMAEWNPPEWGWGLRLHVALFDVRDGAFESLENQSVLAEYEGETRFNYLTISPSARMDVVGGLYVFGGLDFELNTGSEAVVVPTVDSTALIRERRAVQLDVHGFRMGIHVGAAYEVLMLEVAQSARVRFAPFLSLHYGTEVTNNLNSDLNLGFMRLGLELKVALNSETRILRRYDPTYLEPTVYLATLTNRFDYEIPSIQPSERIAVAALDIMPRPVPEAPVIDSVTVEPPTVASAEVRTPRPRRPAIQLAGLNEEFILGVDGGALSTDLTGESYDYLDAVVNFLNQNSSVEVQIAGYTDNFGTPEETQRVSELRANHVYNYLQRKGINPNRLYRSGLGARSPIANNITEEGRKRNRRVAITLIE